MREPPPSLPNRTREEETDDHTRRSPECRTPRRRCTDRRRRGGLRARRCGGQNQPGCRDGAYGQPFPSSGSRTRAVRVPSEAIPGGSSRSWRHSKRIHTSISSTGTRSRTQPWNPSCRASESDGSSSWGHRPMRVSARPSMARSSGDTTPLSSATRTRRKTIPRGAHRPQSTSSPTRTSTGRTRRRLAGRLKSSLRRLSSSARQPEPLASPNEPSFVRGCAPSPWA